MSKFKKWELKRELLNRYRSNAEEHYSKTGVSVLEYIDFLEKLTNITTK